MSSLGEYEEGRKAGIKLVVDDMEEAISKAKVRYIISTVAKCLEKWQAYLKSKK